jgi:transposase
VPWRDLPEAFGRWNIRRCKGVFESIFTALSGDFEYALVDGTIVRQHGAGAKGGTQAIGRAA